MYLNARREFFCVIEMPGEPGLQLLQEVCDEGFGVVGRDDLLALGSLITTRKGAGSGQKEISSNWCVSATTFA